jgi:hypothetical protein
LGLEVSSVKVLGFLVLESRFVLPILGFRVLIHGFEFLGFQGFLFKFSGLQFGVWDS